MKKFAALLLTMSLLLTGCGVQAATHTQTTAPAQTEENTIPTTAETTVATEESVPETTVPETVPEETVPVETEPEQTQPATGQASPQQDKPQQTTTQSSSQSTTQSKPQQTAKPSTSSRPTSSATCKDTGSDRIWEAPDDDYLDAYEERDPDRKLYLQYLQQSGNYYCFYLEEENMRMYLGRTYGMHLVAELEVAQACTWSSSDPTVATVGRLGFVTPLKQGETVITVTYVDPQTQESISRSCNVRVEEEPVYTYTYAELEQRAHEEAKKIADYAMENGKTDLEKIGIAAAFINIYVGEGSSGSRYDVVDGELVTAMVPGYNQPFGTLVTFYSTCAGDVRALGLVLEYMGFEWYHVNENQWDHQWCVVYDVDGQTAFADGSMYGVVGYGQRQEDRSNWMHYENGALVAA